MIKGERVEKVQEIEKIERRGKGIIRKGEKKLEGKRRGEGKERKGKNFKKKKEGISEVMGQERRERIGRGRERGERR